jgi:DNA-binding response OmpR family regulator
MKQNVLFIDDESSMLFAMGEYFSGRGFEVDCALDTWHADRLIVSRRYDAVVCDLPLEGRRSLDALGLIDAITRHVEPRPCLVLLVESYSKLRENQGTRRIADAIVQKPMALAVLELTLCTLLPGNGAAAQA